MSIELFIHGVPNGQDFWGNSEDKAYFGNFYTENSDKVKFFIQTRTLNGKAFCCYNYLVYENVVANGGRAGSYFGISVRFDAYCKDFSQMFRILDTIYNVYVLDSIIKSENGKLEYTTSSFANVSDKLEEIKKATYQLIQQGLNNEDFVSLNGFATSGNNFPNVNLYDYPAEAIMSHIQKNAGISLSPYYPNKKEDDMKKQYDANIKSIQQQTEQRLKAETEGRKEAESRVASAAGQIEQLSKELEEKKSQIKKNGNAKKIEQIVEPIKKPLEELSAILGKPSAAESSEKTSGQAQNKKGKKKYEDESKNSRSDNEKKLGRLSLPLLNTILLLPILGLLILLYFGKVCNSPDKGDTPTAEMKGDSWKKKIKTNYTTKAATEPSESSMESYPEDVNFDTTKVEINVEPYKGGDLEKGKAYTVTAINGSDNGFWEVKGGKIDNQESKRMIFTPDTNTVTIVYRVGEKKKERTIPKKK